MRLWLAHRTWNLFRGLQGDCLGRRGTFLSCGFVLPRTRSSLAVRSGNMDSLRPSSDTSSFSVRTLGLGLNGPKPVQPSGPTIAPQNHAAWILERGGGFWCSRAYVMASWVLFPHGCQSFLGYSWHVLGVSAYEAHHHQCFFFGHSADCFGIQKAYSMVPLWNDVNLETKGSLGNWWNSFYLTFFLWTLCAVSFPRFRLLYKASWEDYPPHLLALEPCGSSKFLFIFLEQKTKKDAAWIMGVAAEAEGTEAKDPPILRPDKKEHSLPSTRNRS